MRRSAGPALLLLCLGSSAHASRMGTPAWQAYDVAELVLEVQVADERSPKQNEDGKRRGIRRSVREAGAFYRVRVKNVFKAPDGHGSVKELVIYVKDAHVLSSAMGPQLEVGRTYITFLKRAKISYFVSRFYDIPAGPAWSQIENYRFDPNSKRSLETREALLTIFRYKKLANDEERREYIRDILMSSDSRMLLDSAIGEVWRRGFELRDALGEAGERLLDRNARVAVRALVLCKKQGGTVKNSVMKELFGRGAERVPYMALQLVGEDDVDALKYTIGEMLKSREHAKYDGAIKKLAELRPSYLESAIANEETRALVCYMAVQELRKRQYEFKGPLRFESVLDLPHNLALASCEAYDGNMFYLRLFSVGSLSRKCSFDQWAKGLRLIEFRLNDPDRRRAAAVVSAFRSRGIDLKLVDGKYHPVSYERPVGSPVAVGIKLPPRDFRVGEAVPIELVESTARPGERMCLAGEWRVEVWGPVRGVSVRLDDGDGEEKYVRLVAGDRRTKVTSHTFENPGRHTISAFKVYRYDDRKDGGAWTGATEPASARIEVKE